METHGEEIIKKALEGTPPIKTPHDLKLSRVGVAKPYDAIWENGRQVTIYPDGKVVDRGTGQIIRQSDTSGSINNEINREIIRNLAPFTLITNGTKSVTSAGTRESLVADDTPARSVRIRANTANTNNVYIGGSLVTTSNATEKLAADESVTINIENAKNIWLDVDTNGEGVAYAILI